MTELVVRAPGRVNLIGEHTDYNEGFVLPVAIDLEVRIAFRPIEGSTVRLDSAQVPGLRSFDLDDLAADRPVDGWLRYVAGTAWSMREAGLAVRAIEGAVDSTIPVGAGLSSSAALELASALALLDPDGARPHSTDLARLAQRAENRYVGVNSGIMDQLASAAGRTGHAMLIDCRSLGLEYVPLPADLALVVCDTGSPRRLEASAYNERRAECEEGVRRIAERVRGVASLRDVDEETLARLRPELPEVVARRCEHVVRENARVHAAVAALRSGDLEALGQIFAASHESLRDLYEVSSPELDAMVEIARSVPGVVASRMTGAGFGGCTVNLVERDAEERLAAAVAREYPRRTGLAGVVYRVSAVDGAGFAAGFTAG